MTENTLPLVLPEFDTLKSAFVEYLSTQPEYTDYNFAGSGLSTLLDVHALNTHYLAFYLNQVGNESFLNTAIKRSSIVSRAKGLGYVPRTVSSASLGVQLEFIKDDTNTPFSNITLSGVTLVASYLNTYYIFSTTDAITIKEIDNRYISKEFTVYEGKRLTYSITMTEDIQNNGFIIPNSEVDINQVTVNVTENNVVTRYTVYTNILEVGQTTKGFFYYENADGKIVLEFGNNELGYRPPIGSILTVDYVVSSGAAANGIDTFNIVNAPALSGTIRVGIAAPSSGGSAAESDKSIKALAPLSFTAQNRAVTSNDYVSILKSKYPNIDDVIAYGGETIYPPKYGKTLVVVKLKNSLNLTTYDKLSIAAELKKYNVTTVTPIILDPDFVYINLNAIVLYNPSILSIAKEALELKIRASILLYQDNYLSGFNKDFRYSSFLRTIDFTDKAIISNNTKITLEKRLNPVIGSRTFIDTTFNNPIVNGSVITTLFTYNKNSNCFIDDSLTGILAIYQYKDNIKRAIASNFGTVDYNTGLINIPAITIDSLDNANNVNTLTNERFFSIYATPINNDVIVEKTNIAAFNNITLSLSGDS